MNLMMFPKMFASHDEGWTWLMRVHPSVVKMYFLYVAPMSVLPAAMVFYAAHTYGDLMPGSLTTMDAWQLAGLFFVTELIAVPVVARVIQRIGAVAQVHPAYEDAFDFAAVVATPLWLSALALFVPSLAINALAMAVALFASGMLIYQGTYRLFKLEDEGRSLLLAGSILAAGLVAWVALMGLAFVAWGWALT